jgi:hypothetical protein
MSGLNSRGLSAFVEVFVEVILKKKLFISTVLQAQAGELEERWVRPLEVSRLMFSDHK